MGLDYFGGHSAVKTENITSMSLLEIRFKTKEPSGLLAYSFKEVCILSLSVDQVIVLLPPTCRPRVRQFFSCLNWELSFVRMN